MTEKSFLSGILKKNDQRDNSKLNMNLNLLSSLKLQQNKNSNLSFNNILFNKEEEYNNSSKNSTSDVFYKNNNISPCNGCNKENVDKMNIFPYQSFPFNYNINNNYYNNHINCLLNFPLIFPLNNLFNSLYNPLLLFQNNLSNHCSFCNFIKPFPKNQEFTQEIPKEEKILLNSNDVKKINNKSFLNKKRKKNNIKFDVKQSIINNKNNTDTKNQKENIPKDNNEETNNIMLQEKNKNNNTFVIYRKSKYVFKKRKPKAIKYVEASSLKCEHCNAEIKTKKMKVYHHFKKTKECFDDTINLLKMISEIKNIILRNVNNFENEKIIKIVTMYKETMKSISLSDYIDISCEFNKTKL